jgi:dihydrodipicolinate synthase/N-acetylneuraminate lyase
VIIVQATPFNADGSLDVPELRANTQFLIAKCKGRRLVLVPTGSTGEAYALSDSERIKAIENRDRYGCGRIAGGRGHRRGGRRRHAQRAD